MKQIVKKNRIEIHPENKEEQLLLESMFFDRYVANIVHFDKEEMVDFVELTCVEE